MTDRSQVRFPIWERQDWETDQQWGAFQHYRNTPPLVRSLDKTSAETFVNFRKVQAWANEERWSQRALAYDRHIDSQALASVSMQEQAAIIRRQRLEVLALFSDVVKDELIALRRQQARRAETAGDYSILKPHEIVRFLKDPMILERLLLGESTENVSIRREVEKLGALSQEELDQLEDLASKLEKKKTAILTEGHEIKH